jgi:hypothetical protein
MTLNPLKIFTAKILPRMVESLLVLAAGKSKCLQQIRNGIGLQLVEITT